MLDFQLLNAEAAPVDVTMMWRRDRVLMHPQIKLAHEPQRAPDEVGRLTAIIGQNGTGKTHLLASIIDCMLAIENAAKGRVSGTRQLPLQRLSYNVGSSTIVLERVDEGRATALVDGVQVTLDEVPLPERIVALTITPFDKFPVPRLATFSVQPMDESRYRYLGLRDRTGKASIENLLFRSLNSLFETKSNPAVSRARISRVFDFLKLKPKLTVVYRLRVSREVLRACHDGGPILNGEVMRDSSRLRRSQEVVKSGQATEEELIDAILYADRIKDRGFVRLTANFEADGYVDPDFALLQPIRRAGFLQLTAVEVEQDSGLITDLKRASSGQISIATALLSLASEIQDGSLVLIDEPELSLHPDWQIKYIDLLLDTFRGYRGCHFIIATHSPLVISELPSHATLVALDNPDAPSAAELAGQSSDFQLAEAFQLTSNNNLHLRDLMLDAMRVAADGEADSPAFRDQVAHLEKITSKLDPEDGVRMVVDGLSKAAAHAIGNKNAAS
ncbi:AAA family ATPase [Sphingomonas sp. R-74633]|uniref:ATP-binding protein n=1 Tax=Sphingomonas sp. R-74633 TaxID=2751188 RepID=UPI0015D24CB9|nr:AAA family ATPase [Sphingomonas sp. R-74633]NYT40771.1 AAA family ATPase [Sphingomonas sp. R-74633]